MPRRSTPTVSVSARYPRRPGQPHLIGLKLAELKRLASDFGITEISDKRVSSDFRRAIWQLLVGAPDVELTESEVPLSAEDGKQIASALEGYYPRFHLFRSDRAGVESDELAQDPAKLVVKSVLDRHAARLSELTAEIQSEITEQLQSVVDKLQQVAPELASGLSPRNIEPNWQKAFSSLHFEDQNQVSLAKRGSGTRRLVLLSFFRAEAERLQSAEDGWHRGIIIAVEEPETALHPDLQRQAVTSLMEIATSENRQIFITTHSSNLIRHLPIDALLYADQSTGSIVWRSAKSDGSLQVLRLLDQAMGTFTDHNVRCFILVEGSNDIGGLLAFSDAIVKKDASFPNLRELERRGMICFIPIGGCGAAALWESRLSPFKRPEIHILDSDRASSTAPMKKNVLSYIERYAATVSDACQVLVLNRRELENFLTKESITSRLSEVSEEFATEFLGEVTAADWNFADIPGLVADASVRANNKYTWNSSTSKKELIECFGHESVARKALETGPQHDLLRILDFVASHTGSPTSSAAPLR